MQALDIDYVFGSACDMNIFLLKAEKLCIEGLTCLLMIRE